MANQLSAYHSWAKLLFITLLCKMKSQRFKIFSPIRQGEQENLIVVFLMLELLV